MATLDEKLKMGLDDIPQTHGGGKAPRQRPKKTRATNTGSAVVTSKVFVGNLSFDTTWKGLKDRFNQIGNVNFADVATRDDGKSKGWGTVEFANPADARKAIRELNGAEIDGRPVTVRADRDAEGGSRPAKGAKGAPRAAGSARYTVHVGNLSFDTSWQNLKDFMRSAGDVLHVDVKQRPDGKSRGWALVEFETGKAAKTAVNTLNGRELDGRAITVKRDGDSTEGGASKPAAARSAASGTKVHVGQLSFDTDWRSLKDFMRSAGEVARADVAARPDGRSKGWGTVEFRTARGAAAAIRDLNGATLDGRAIIVRADRDSGPSASAGSSSGSSGGRVYVGNIPWNIHWQDLKDYFREQGFDVAHVDIPTVAGSDKSKGFALIEFTSKAEANRAISHLNGIEMNGRQLSARFDNRS